MYICIRLQMHTYMNMYICVCALCFIWSSAKLLLTVFRLHFNTFFSVVEKFHLIKQITKASQSTTAAAATGAAQPQRCCLAIFRLCALPFHFVLFFCVLLLAKHQKRSSNNRNNTQIECATWKWDDLPHRDTRCGCRRCLRRCPLSALC